MGLFDLFKKKENPAVSVSVTIGKARPIEVEVAQRTPGELPLADVDGYVSPSGGFVNFGRFCVVGMNASTGRKNTKRYEVQTEGDARAAAAADGLTEPIAVNVEPMPAPTERQTDYVLDLKAALPAGVCSEDVSAIISRITDEDEGAPDPGLSRYAHACKVRFSRFIGKSAILGAMFHQMKDADRATLYAYSVYLQEKGGGFRDPRSLSVFPAFCEFGETAAGDPSLLKSLADREAIDLLAPNRGTKIYKAAAAFLSERGAV